MATHAGTGWPGHEPRPTVAAVLPGGGARGAYEIGALSVLLPALEARGERVTVWCGTSVGAINATVLASLAHLSAKEQTRSGMSLWAGLRKQDVMSPLAGRGGVRVATRLIGHALGLSGLGFASLLDPTPLAASLDRWVDWDQLDSNVEDQRVDAVSVVATSLLTGDPVAFVSSANGVPKHLDDGSRYVETRLRGEHVRASAAIPLLFPTVEVTTPRSARGHYADGGIRLNSPIKPALDLGADRVIVIGLEPFTPATGRPLSPAGPSIADVVANVLDGLLVDQVAHDLRRLVAINSFFVEDARTGTLHSSRAYRLARGHAPYRPISYALVSPRRRGEIGRLADAVFERRYSGLKALRDLDYALIARALGGRTSSRGELFSFLLFDHVFIEELLRMGRRDARRWLRRHPRFWCRDAAHDLSIGQMDRTAIQEEATIEEFRAHRRH